MKSFKQHLAEKAGYTLWQVNIKGKLSNKEHLSHDELDDRMEELYGKVATIKVKQDGGKEITYTDDGTKWSKV